MTQISPLKPLEIRRWLARSGAIALLGAGLLVSTSGWAQDDKGGDAPASPPPRLGPATPGRGLVPPQVPPPAPEPDEPSGGASRTPGDTTAASGAGGTGGVNAKKVPCVPPSTKVNMDYVDASLMDVTKYMAEITCRNFILGDDLKGQITIISHQQVTVAEAYEAYLSALEVAGYTTVAVGKNTKVVPASKAGNVPLRVYHGDAIPETDNFVTQIIQLDNVTVSDVSTVVKEMAGPSAKVIAYAPTNTLIITDAAYNIRRVYRIVRELDVAAPKSQMEVIPIRYAAAADVERILEEVYGVAATTTASTPAPASGTTAARRRGRRDDTAEAAPTSATATNVGTEGAYISKIIADERTNSLIILANSEAITKIRALIASIDIDIDPASRSQIHVIYLEHAKATDVATVLSNLSDGRGGSGGTSSRTSTSGTSRTGTSSSSTNRARSSGTFGSGSSTNRGYSPTMPGGAGPDGGGATPAVGGAGSVVAAFDSGMRITADENTNSLVIIAAPEDFRVLKGVIDRLDIPRRQVYVEAVVVEVGSTDESQIGIGVHGGAATGAGGLQYGSAQLGAQTLQFDVSSVLSGFAMGVFGPAIETGLTSAEGTPITIPAFGVALQALATNSEVNILSNPNLLVVDNEEATITVGRNVPFPVSSGYSTNGLPVTSYQREDVGITLKVTPQINEANYVTMELALEVAEVEEDSSSLVDVNQAGFITSKRQVENVVVVQDNQTIVIGGLIGNTQTEVQTKIPVLGDIPILGVLFRGKSNTERRTNLLIFLTPHVINEPADLEEVYRVKMAQREEFVRRFYGKSREDQEAEFEALMQSSMNLIDKPSSYRTKAAPHPADETIDDELVPTGGSANTGPTANPDGTPVVVPVPSGDPTVPAVPATPAPVEDQPGVPETPGTPGEPGSPGEPVPDEGQ
jgi:general secretion pathway protein D